MHEVCKIKNLTWRVSKSMRRIFLGWIWNCLQNCSKLYVINILNFFESHHIWPKNWPGTLFFPTSCIVQLFDFFETSLIASSKYIMAIRTQEFLQSCKISWDFTRNIFHLKNRALSNSFAKNSHIYFLCNLASTWPLTDPVFQTNGVIVSLMKVDKRISVVQNQVCSTSRPLDWRTRVLFIKGY